MRRIAQLAIATAAAAAVFATTLTPSHSRGAAALDFWSWDGTVRGEGGSPSRDRIIVTIPGQGGVQDQNQGGAETGNGSRRESPARGGFRER